MPYRDASAPQRSTDPVDYQNLPCPVAAMAKRFDDAFEIAAHSHKRAQLLYAQSGTMRIRAHNQAWIVPPDRAVLIPGGVAHSVAMRGDVEMRTLYIDPAADTRLPATPVVLVVSELLRALVLALLEEPLVYQATARGGLISRLILDEICRGRQLNMAIPMPADRRLVRLCERLLDDPSRGERLEDWSAGAGASARTLARLFHSELGMTFAAWRQRVRFHSAVERLVLGEQVASVARRNGYRSPSAFSSAFRKSLGVTPKQIQAARDG